MTLAERFAAAEQRIENVNLTIEQWNDVVALLSPTELAMLNGFDDAQLDKILDPTLESNPFRDQHHELALVVDQLMEDRIIGEYE